MYTNLGPCENNFSEDSNWTTSTGGKGDILSPYIANLYKWILFFRFEAHFTKVKASKKYLERWKLSTAQKKQGVKAATVYVGPHTQMSDRSPKAPNLYPNHTGNLQTPHPSGPKSTFEVV